ncbi:MAG: anthranilate synthase component I, partial [Acidimicrobiia bacterium]|nr:anthranilate synthase component I [Acidimicrobiia bacterium]
MTPNLSLDEFVGLAADHDVVPLTLRVMADRETPVSLFEKLVGDQPGFLLESLVGGEQWARWSFVGWDPLTTIRSHDGVTSARGSIDLELPDTDPLSVLEDVVGRHRTPHLDDLPPLHTGLVGYLGYDCVRYVEHLPDRPEDDRGLPEMVWQMVGSLAAIDAVRQEIVLVRNVVIDGDPAAQYRAALALLQRTVERIGDPSAYHPHAALDRGLPSLDGVSSSVSREDFEAAVDSARR